jgi:hypothetical protein
MNLSIKFQRSEVEEKKPEETSRKILDVKLAKFDSSSLNKRHIEERTRTTNNAAACGVVDLLSNYVIRNI